MKKTAALILGVSALVVLSVPALAQIPPPTPAPAPAPAPAVLAPPSAMPAPASPAPTPAAASMAAPPAPAAAPQAKPAKPPKPAKPAEAPPAPDAAPTPQPPEPARAPEAPPRERFDADPVNVRFEVTVSSQTGSAAAVRRSAMVTVSNGAVPGPNGMGMLRSGNSVPVPTTALTTKGEDGKETPAARPITSYNYRSVGLNVDASNVAVLPGNRVRATLNIEFSGVDDKASASTGAPSFPTFSQRLQLYLDSGKPLMVAQSSDFVDNVERKQTVEVKATILR